MKTKLLLQLFVSFFKIGLISFGGGYTVVPLLQFEAVESRKWLSKDDLMDIMSISQTFPGAIIANASTMVGYRVCGLTGAILATTATLIPTFVLTLIITIFFWNFTENIFVKKAFTGILIGVTSLIIYSITNMWKSSVRNYFDILMVVLSTGALILFKVNAVFIILAVLVTGFIYNLFRFRKGGEKK